MEEDWEGAPLESAGAGAVVQPTQVLAELPDIKLFNRWSCDDVQVSDMSLRLHRSQGKVCQVPSSLSRSVPGQEVPEGPVPHC